MRSKSLLLGSTLAIAAIAICWRAAEAHATLLSSDPAANAKLAVAPTRIRLKFSEPVDAAVRRSHDVLLPSRWVHSRRDHLAVDVDAGNPVVRSPGRCLGSSRRS